jgi:hypothetical protein
MLTGQLLTLSEHADTTDQLDDATVCNKVCKRVVAVVLKR